MAVLPIVKYPDPVLKQEAEPIREINEDIRTLARDMLDTVIAAPGAGLAAPQVARSCRLIVVDATKDGHFKDLMILINPEIIEARGEQLYEEACLSVIDYSAKVRRAEWVKVRAMDLEGDPLEIETDGRLAVVFQHEIDHLDGKLFIDRISGLKRDLYKRKLKKILAKQQEGE